MKDSFIILWFANYKDWLKVNNNNNNNYYYYYYYYSNRYRNEKSKMCVVYLLYVGFDPGVRRRKHVAGELHVSDDRQRFVGTLSVDADVALEKNRQRI